jgi:hypothetical protein
VIWVILVVRLEENSLCQLLVPAARARRTAVQKTASAVGIVFLAVLGTSAG